MWRNSRGPCFAATSQSQKVTLKSRTFVRCYLLTDLISSLQLGVPKYLENFLVSEGCYINISPSFLIDASVYDTCFPFLRYFQMSLTFKYHLFTKQLTDFVVLKNTRQTWTCYRWHTTLAQRFHQPYLGSFSKFQGKTGAPQPNAWNIASLTALSQCDTDKKTKLQCESTRHQTTLFSLSFFCLYFNLFLSLKEIQIH